MSVTLAVVRNRVRAKLNELDPRKNSRDVVEIDNAIADAYLLLDSQLPAPHSYTASAFTIAANSDTFTLPAAGAEYAGDVRIRLTNHRYFLTKRTVEEIDAMRDWVLPSQVAWPRDFALWEDPSQIVQGRCWPTASVAEPCDLFANLTATDLRDAASMDAATIGFARYGSEALIYYAAAELAAGMTAEDLALRRLNPQSATLWRKAADTLLYQEEVRMSSIQSVGRIQRWVS